MSSLRWDVAIPRRRGVAATRTFRGDESLRGTSVETAAHHRYLSGGGAATVVVPLVAPSDATKPPAGRGGECFCCLPRPGKHMSFDGRFLHAAPERIYAAEAGDARRVTLLVNVWLDWRPRDADALPEAARATLPRSPKTAALDFANERRIEAIPVPTAPATKPRGWTFLAGDHKTRVALRLPGPLPGAAPDAAVLFQDAPGAPPLVEVAPRA